MSHALVTKKMRLEHKENWKANIVAQNLVLASIF